MDQLKNRFWTQYHELLNDIEIAGYYIEYATDEYIIIQSKQNNKLHRLYLGGAGNTMYIDRIEEERT